MSIPSPASLFSNLTNVTNVTNVTDNLCTNTVVRFDRLGRFGRFTKSGAGLDSSGWFRIGSPAVSDPVDLG